MLKMPALSGRFGPYRKFENHPAGMRLLRSAALIGIGVMLSGSHPGPRALPHVISAADAVKYRQIFKAERDQKSATAKRLIDGLDDPILMGHVLAERHLRAKRPSYKAIRQWLREYRGHPDAERIYALAIRHRPDGVRLPVSPKAKSAALGAETTPPRTYFSDRKRSRAQQLKVADIKRALRIWLKRGWIGRFEKLLQRGYVVRLLDRFEMNKARSMVAAAWFYRGDDEKALRIASAALTQAGKELPLTHWVAGLAAWRQKRHELAAQHFSTLAATPKVSPWIASGAAYWAARTYARLGDSGQSGKWLAEAARHRYTLYGLLARSALGVKAHGYAHPPTLTRSMAVRLTELPRGKRALALIQIGEKIRAEQELLHIEDWRRPEIAEALQALAHRSNLPALSLKLARRLSSRTGGYAAGLFPLPPWASDGQPGIDRALIYAVMRQESDFDAFAESPVGARGLMQIMPATARSIRKPGNRMNLFDPEENIELGQTYLDRLKETPSIKENLLRMIAAYNSGPGNVRYWQRRLMKFGDDPLLFIETLPVLETRLFVRRVLANLWIYRDRLGQPTPSLRALAKGEWPKYRSYDDVGVAQARPGS